eukprot:2971199-Rhodomonas_salina.2
MSSLPWMRRVGTARAAASAGISGNALYDSMYPAPSSQCWGLFSAPCGKKGAVHTPFVCTLSSCSPTQHTYLTSGRFVRQSETLSSLPPASLPPHLLRAEV